MIGYPGMLIVAFDGGANNYSHIMGYTGAGWHEIWRAPKAGWRIRGLGIEPMPGDAVDRLHLSCGSYELWVPLSVDPFNHTVDSYNPYLYNPVNEIVSPWYYMSRREIEKLWGTFRAIVETGSGALVNVFYRTDETTAWTYLGQWNKFAGAELTLSSTYNVTGRRIQFLVQFGPTTDAEITPRIVGWVIEALMKSPKRNRIVLTALVQDDPTTIQGKPDSTYTTASAKLTQLETWDGAPTALLMTSRINAFTAKYYVLDKGGYRIMQDLGNERYIVQLSLLEL